MQLEIRGMYNVDVDVDVNVINYCSFLNLIWDIG